MFAKLLKIFATRCNIKTNIRSETPRLEGYEMSNEEYKEYIIEMIQKINNLEQSGQVRINDIEWMARTSSDEVTIPEHAIVTIEDVQENGQVSPFFIM